jgi:hypothetical protein
VSSAAFVRDVLAMAFPHSGGRSGYLVTLGVYMDKSFKDGSAVSVGAVIFESSRVPDFTAEWAATLFGFEELESFHMAEFDSGIGVYSDWKERGVKYERFQRLLDLIEKYALAVLATTASVKDLQEWYGDKDVIAGLGVCATNTIMTVPMYRGLRENPRERVVYTFEDGDEGKGKLESAYDEMYADRDRRSGYRLSGKMAFGKKDMPPLQAADIVAFEGVKMWERDAGVVDLRPRYSYTWLNDHVPSVWPTLRPMVFGLTSAAPLIPWG